MLLTSPADYSLMAIYLPGTVEEEQLALDELTPREIVAELDKHVVGQKDAKRAVAIALRNRMRRQKLSPELAEEIIPKNIIMIGPTGVGKTEIARRLAKLANSPFLKVEASKFTEVGYVGRDVESMIRDLVEIAIEMVREEKLEDVADKAELNAEERLLDILLPSSPPPRPESAGGLVLEGNTTGAESQARTRRGRLPSSARSSIVQPAPIDRARVHDDAGAERHVVGDLHVLAEQQAGGARIGPQHGRRSCGERSATR